jgi:hypothetical protein
MATGKCTCSLSDDYSYHTRVFYNYDPSSHHWGVMHFEEGPASWTCPEGMWYSGITDMDFCLVHGKSHDHRGVYLYPYNGVVNGWIVENGYLTSKVKTPPVKTASPSTAPTVEAATETVVVYQSVTGTVVVKKSIVDQLKVYNHEIGF